MDTRALFTRGFTAEARLSWSILERRDGLPREFRDGHPWHELTVTEWDALRVAHSVTIGINSATAATEFQVRGRDGGIVLLPVPGRVAPDHLGRPRPEPQIGMDLLQIHRGGSILETTLSLLLPRDRLRLLWWPDAETTEPLRAAGLHRDVVLLETRRNDRLLTFCLSDRVSCDGALRLVRPFDPYAEPNLMR